MPEAAYAIGARPGAATARCEKVPRLKSEAVSAHGQADAVAGVPHGWVRPKRWPDGHAAEHLVAREPVGQVASLYTAYGGTRVS
jgi:hypothetical protein